MSETTWESSTPVSYRICLDRVSERIRPLGVERIPVEQALGRIAARDLIAPIDIPPHAVSMRDGFALRSSETAGAGLIVPRQLKVAGHVHPETSPRDLAPLGPGEAYLIGTGAPLPSGADAVLTMEKAVHKEGWVLVSEPVKAGTGVLPTGGDVRRSTPIVGEGSMLHPPRLGLLATTGLERIEVYRRPHVGLIETGDEFPTQPPSDLLTLGAWCSRFQLPVERWICGDSRGEIAAALDEALASCDAVVTIGGTGAGPRDLIRTVLGEINGRLLVDGVRLRPGRTTRFALVRGKPVFALPGRPTANEMAFLLIALPSIMRLAGARARPFPEVPARLARDLRRPPDQRHWTHAVKVHLYADDYFLHAVPLVGRAVQKDRGRLQAAASGVGVLLMEEGEAGLRRGDVLPVLLLEQSWL